MANKRPFLLFSSSVALMLALHQGASAEEPVAAEPPPTGVSSTPPPASPTPPETAAAGSETAPPSESTAQSRPAEPQAPTAPVPAGAAHAGRTPPTDTKDAAASAPQSAVPVGKTPQPPSHSIQMDAARKRMEKRRAEMMERRMRRYEELRERAAEFGLELPETPPWQLKSDEERKTHREKMRAMSPEERRAMRDKHWEKMRDRAREQGIEMPETPPWKQAEQRREAMKAQWESYKEIFNALTQEQKEAIQALFGSGHRRVSPPPAMERQIPPGPPAQVPFGMQQDYGFPASPGLPDYGRPGAGPSTFEMGPTAPWYGGEQPMQPGATPYWPSGNEGWIQGPPPPGTE